LATRWFDQKFAPSKANERDYIRESRPTKILCSQRPRKRGIAPKEVTEKIREAILTLERQIDVKVYSKDLHLIHL
jgi:hypothetical protein